MTGHSPPPKRKPLIVKAIPARGRQHNPKPRSERGLRRRERMNTEGLSAQGHALRYCDTRSNLKGRK